MQAICNNWLSGIFTLLNTKTIDYSLSKKIIIKFKRRRGWVNNVKDLQFMIYGQRKERSKMKRKGNDSNFWRWCQSHVPQFTYEKLQRISKGKSEEPNYRVKLRNTMMMNDEGSWNRKGWCRRNVFCKFYIFCPSWRSWISNLHRYSALDEIKHIWLKLS